MSAPLLFGQAPVIVVQTSGAVEYLPALSAESRRVFPGEQLPSDGFIRFAEGSRVKLLFQGQPQSLEQGGTYDIRELVRENTPKRSLNFIGRFWDFVSEGIFNSSNTNQLKEYHDRYSSRSGGIRGFGEKNYPITSFSLLHGRLEEDEVTFRWAPFSTDSIYQLLIYRQQDQVLRFQVLTRDTFLTLDLGRLYFKPGEVYYWLVRIDGPAGEETRSAERTFVVDPGAREQALTPVFSSPGYQSASESEQGLMEAYALEKQGLVYAADRRYRDLRQQFPDDGLIARLHVAFLARQATLEEAEKQR